MRALRKKGMIQWESFFRAFPMEKWFRGSSIFWVTGMAHGGISSQAYAALQGRLFAMIRDPRERGWSAYDEFFGRTNQRQQFHPLAIPSF